MRKARNFPLPKKEDLHPINEKITSTRVRLVGGNVVSGTYPLEEALKMSREMGLDLVEINSKISPSICKILDYRKFSFDQKKRQDKIKSGQNRSPMKEIRIGPDTDVHDFNHRRQLAEKFLEKGNKIKVSMTFKGRAIHTRVDGGKEKLSKFALDLQEIGKIEIPPTLEGNRLYMILASKKK